MWHPSVLSDIYQLFHFSTDEAADDRQLVDEPSGKARGLRGEPPHRPATIGGVRAPVTGTDPDTKRRNGQSSGHTSTRPYVCLSACECELQLIVQLSLSGSGWLVLWWVFVWFGCVFRNFRPNVCLPAYGVCLRTLPPLTVQTCRDEEQRRQETAVGPRAGLLRSFTPDE